MKGVLETAVYMPGGSIHKTLVGASMDQIEPEQLKQSSFVAEDILAYAQNEARRLSAVMDDGASITVSLDAELRPDETAINSTATRVDIRGGSAPSALHGVYTFFEKLGCVFDFSGERLPRWSKSARLPSIDERHIPSTAERGIRMHLNFVQDQSHFSEEEFSTFIDNMARLRFNHLQFHMYTQLQWFLAEIGDPTV